MKLLKLSQHSFLNKHAPIIRIQERKNYAPWITNDTKELMKQRDEYKNKAKLLNKESKNNGVSSASPEEKAAWDKYKKLRNQINNRKKLESTKYNSIRVSENIDDSSSSWSTVKDIIGWKSSKTVNQLSENGNLVTKAY